MRRSRCRLLAVTACLFLAAACGPRGGPDGGVSDAGGGGDAIGVRVATFNAHLFFDTTCESGLCGPGDFEQVPSSQAFDSRAREIARGIVGLGAEVVALQEIETEASLDAIVSELPGSYAYSAFGETGRPGSLDVAVVSVLPILGVRRHRDRVLRRPDGTQTTFTRELLEVHLSVGERRLVVLCAHFRSKWQDDPGRRVAEAEASGEILGEIAAELPEATIVLAGDLNDVPGSPALQALEAAAPVERVAAELGGAETTFVYQGKPYALDHIYHVTSAAGRYQSGTAEVERDDATGYAGSDHAALRADFRL